MLRSQTLRGPSVQQKPKWNHDGILRTRFTKLWKSEIHINLKIDDALKRRCCRFGVVRTVYHTHQGQ